MTLRLPSCAICGKRLLLKAGSRMIVTERGKPRLGYCERHIRQGVARIQGAATMESEKRG